jgi:hypothetical protein
MKRSPVGLEGTKGHKHTKRFFVSFVPFRRR